MQILIFGIMLLIVLAVGFYGYVKTKDLEDYYLAGRKLGVWLAAGSFGATYISSVTIVGFTGTSYLRGYGFFAFLLIPIAIAWLVLYFIAGELRRLGPVTVSEYLEQRFKSPFLSMWSAAIYLAILCIFVILQLRGIGLVLQQLVGWEYSTVVLLIGAILLLYTTFGGMTSVVWTDGIQFIILWLGVSIGTIYIIVTQFGSVSNLNARLALVTGGINNVSAGDLVSFNQGGSLTWLTIGSMVIFAVVASSTLPYYLMRLFICKDTLTAKGMIGVSGAFMVVFYTFIVLAGSAARVLEPNLQSADHAFPLLMNNYLPPVLGGFVLSAVGAAILSTADSALIAAGTIFSKDFYAKIKKDVSEQQLFVISRIATGTIGVLGMLLALRPPKMMLDLWVFQAAVIGGAIAAPLYAGVFWKGAKKEGAIAGTVAGCITAIIWDLNKPWGIAGAAAGAVIGLILLVVISLAVKEKDAASTLTGSQSK
ncbi:MAG: sodium:solute symporter family protein [Bacillota bacterium]